jgi:hypothetical protein
VLANQLNIAHSNLDNSITNVLTVRASVGSRLKEVDNAKSAGSDVVLQYQQTLSGLRDLDYAKAISDLTFATDHAAGGPAVVREDPGLESVQFHSSSAFVRTIRRRGS